MIIRERISNPKLCSICFILVIMLYFSEEEYRELFSAIKILIYSEMSNGNLFVSLSFFRRLPNLFV